MESGFLSQLFNFLSRPFGLVILTCTLVFAYRARRSPRMAWFLVALCCFTASLSEFRDPYVLDPPDLVFPLEQLRAAGRPLSILCVSVLLWLGIQTPNTRGWRHRLLPPAIGALVILQLLIFLKTLASGSVLFALLAIITFGGTVLMVRLGPSRWLQDDRQFYLAIWAIAWVGIIFIIVNGYQAFFDIYPITFVHGALLGTTGNPQHAATLLATTIPCFLFLMQSQIQRSWQVIWAIALVFVCVALFLTASRTGVLMGGLAILLFFRRGQSQFIQAAFLLGLILAALFPSFEQSQGIFNTTSVAHDLFNLEDSRTHIWRTMWQTFSTYPFLGAPLEGDRLGYGENSWLAVAATLGIIGLIPLLFFALSCIRMLIKLDRIASYSQAFTFHSNTVIAGLVSLLIGSIFEAFLLGTITFPLLSLLIYLSLGQYLIERYETLSISSFPYQTHGLEYSES